MTRPSDTAFVHVRYVDGGWEEFEVFHVEPNESAATIKLTLTSGQLLTLFDSGISRVIYTPPTSGE